MERLNPSDDALCIAAATLAAAMIQKEWDLRPQHGAATAENRLGQFFATAIRTIQTEINTIGK